jgi:hypothetical protein
MATFGQMTDEVSRKLAGYTLRQDRQTHLTVAVNTTAVSITVSSATNISTGVIQIDDELIYVDSYDRNKGRKQNKINLNHFQLQEDDVIEMNREESEE